MGEREGAGAPSGERRSVMTKFYQFISSFPHFLICHLYVQYMHMHLDIDADGNTHVGYVFYRALVLLHVHIDDESKDHY
jgi:hypothetical protein